LLASELERPVIPHFTDHWIDTRFVGSPMGRHLRRRLLFWLERVLGRSPVIFAMSELMAEEYARRFQKDCRVFTTLVEEEPYLRAVRRTRHDGEAIRFVYAGSLGLERWGVLQALARALQALRTEGPVGTLEIYCSDEDRRAYKKAIEIPGVAYMREWVPASELPELFVNADVLVHVESPSPRLLPYTRYAFSTKLSQYMMAARCLLLIGPPEAGSMREVLRTGAGVVIGSTSRQQIETALRRILGDQAYREEMGRRARMLAREHFEATRRREEFRCILSAAAVGSIA
jgi:glycosyltransferase involved in cell wall biosynthesis